METSFYQRIVQTLKKHYYSPQYIYFLVSLLLLITLPAIEEAYGKGFLITDFTLAVVISMAALFTSRNRKDLFLLTSIGFFLYFFFIIYQNTGKTLFMTPVLIIIFFVMVLNRILHYVFQEKPISLNDIFALASGFLLLGFMFTPFFVVLQNYFPGSFSKANSSFYDLLYFCFMTLTTVGYGDIAPVHPFAKAGSVLLSVIGQLYLTVVVGIILGKYFQKNS